MIFELKKLIRRPRPMIEDKIWTNHFGVPDAEIRNRNYHSVKLNSILKVS